MAETNLQLSPQLLKMLHDEAAKRGTDINSVVTDVVTKGLSSYRVERKKLAKVEVLDNLPTSLFGVPDDHPIFVKGKTGTGPFQVTVEFN